jgi:5-methylcytosine-specific restriction endonuclease McrA
MNFIQKNSKQKYCSGVCSHKANLIKNRGKRAKRRGPYKIKFCKICGSKIEGVLGKRDYCGKVYCSDKCSNEGVKAKNKKYELKIKGLLIKYCLTCGNELPLHKSKYCSEECTPMKRDRFIILERDNFQCAYCGKTSYGNKVELHVDHIIPRNKGGSNHAENLVTSCSTCNKGRRKGFLTNQEIILEEVAKRNLESGLPPKLIIKLQNGD